MHKVINTGDYGYPVHDYDIEIEEFPDNITEYSLYRSNGGEWTENKRGEKCVSLVNTGNGIVFPKKKYKGELDYAETAELFILLNFINKERNIFKGTIEKSVVLESYEI